MRTTRLATLQTAPIEQDDPTLLDELPTVGDILTSAPAALTERLLAAFDVKATYNRDKHQVTIHATITDATPQAVLDLLSDPRADHNTQPASGPVSALQDHVAHLTGHTGACHSKWQTPDSGRRLAHACGPCRATDDSAQIRMFCAPMNRLSAARKF